MADASIEHRASRLHGLDRDSQSPQFGGGASMSRSDLSNVEATSRHGDPVRGKWEVGRHFSATLGAGALKVEPASPASYAGRKYGVPARERAWPMRTQVHSTLFQNLGMAQTGST